ncbi:uncharacterized protein VP01_2988g3 [Puccinia sorghi]|uniref:Uncharacterized protein n=1 Tax=Puccinia sorghi TaxID=27349 RepID=A0A0L6V295_9BASI|nr:uncharacterized protein VP01_2988g3 [Puccinia sorghi]
MDSPFPPGQEIIPPLGSQPEHHHRPENFIDLTSEGNQDTHNSFDSENLSGNPDEADDDDDDDDDIIFTGHMAALTANIYAGYYSRHPPRVDPTPHQGFSNLTVRDSAAPQTRRPINVGGGGRFSGGQFSGFVAAGLSRFHGLLGPVTTNSNRPRPQPPQDSLHRVFSNWTHDDDFDRLDGDGLPPFRTMAGPFRGDFLSLSPRQIIAAIYDFDHTAHPQESLPPSYKEQDSHPLKIKSGFSKEIIPLDREVLSVDSDSHSHPQLEKQELRPVCASCDEELLMGQDSCAGGSLDGRRPWILACGHVVDSRCLEQAKIRARENKLESHQSKKTRSAERVSASHYQTRASRPSRSNPVADTPAKLVNHNNKRRKISSTHSTQASPSSTSQAVSDLASQRKERADAREARKSIEFSKPLSSHLSDSHLPTHSTETALAANVYATATTKNVKGKGKAKEEANHDPLTECSSSIIIPPTPNTAQPCTKTAPTARTNQAKKPAVGPAAPFDSWIKCPVKGCRGAKGDLLAPPGSKNAPWEMFV